VVVAAVAFGSTFLPVQDALAHVQPVPFLAVRFLVGTAALTLVLAAMGRLGELVRPLSLLGGARSGLWLLAGYVLQTYGLRYTSTPVSAFITYLLVVMVPLITAWRARRPPAPAVAVGVVLAAAGLFLLTGAHLRLGRGEWLTLGCAVAFAFNIVEIDRAVAGGDELAPVLALTAVQLGLVSLGTGVVGAFTGGYRMPAAAIWPAVYTGVACSALALGLQVWGQRRVGPVRTSLLLMIEPVSAALVGTAVGQPLHVLGASGAGLILLGILVSEVLPARRRARA
jgi:drug/metabolite transporter (DMT)-like permease